MTGGDSYYFLGTFSPFTFFLILYTYPFFLFQKSAYTGMLRHSLATFEVDKTSFSGIYNLRNIDAPSFREKPVIGWNKASFRRTDTKLFFRKNCY